jgi:hypothetical protein
MYPRFMGDNEETVDMDEVSKNQVIQGDADIDEDADKGPDAISDDDDDEVEEVEDEEDIDEE